MRPQTFTDVPSTRKPSSLKLRLQAGADEPRPNIGGIQKNHPNPAQPCANSSKRCIKRANIVDGFVWALDGYPMDVIVSGFKQYIRRRADMPTPSDIINIIDPLPAKPEFDKAYYVYLRKLKDEQGEFALTTEEEVYVKAYDEHMKARGRAA